VTGDVFLAGGVRTPFGRFGGGLRDVPPTTLAAETIKVTLEATGCPPDRLDELVLGIGMRAGGTMAPARQALVEAGLPPSLPSITVDRACCSSMSAVGLGLAKIRSGEATNVLAGGAENMSGTPFLLRARWGQRLGDLVAEDPLLMRSPISDEPIARYVGQVALRFAVSREVQDDWAVQSHERYFEALERGYFTAEIVPVQSGGETVSRDEQPRRSTPEALAALPTIYGSPTITAGNAPGLNDGAATLLVSSDPSLHRLGKLLAYAQVSGQLNGSAYLPAVAIRAALSQVGWAIDDVDNLEINEAYAAMPLVSTKVLAEDDESKWAKMLARTNVHGGAVAIGHPMGASGARIVLTLARTLAERGGGRGVAAICGGFGQADAVVIEV
jgi:acetyl-CoA C-acetyltransferase